MSALLSYIMPGFRQSGRAFAAGVSAGPKWLCSESFAEDGSGGGGIGISCSLEFCTYCAFRPSPGSTANKQTNNQSGKNFFFFSFPLAAASETQYSALSPVPPLHLCGFTLALTGTDVAFGAGASQRLLSFLCFCCCVFCHSESGS